MQSTLETIFNTWGDYRGVQKDICIRIVDMLNGHTFSYFSCKVRHQYGEMVS